MKLSTFLAIAAVVAFVFGAAFILAPVQLMSLYGVTLDAAGQWLGRYLGSAFIGVAVINWLARGATHSDAIRPIVAGGFVISATGLVVAALDRLYGSGNALVWSTVAIYLLLTLGYGYFQFGRAATA